MARQDKGNKQSRARGGSAENDMEEDFSGWLTKSEAARATGLSQKTIQTLAKQNKIQSHRWHRPNGPWCQLYHPSDIERVKNERKDPREPFVLPQSQPIPVWPVPPLPPDLVKTNGSALGPLNELVAALYEVYVKPRVTEMIFLSLDDAASLSQLPRRHLRRLIAAGKLDGLKTGKGWRIRRADLDKI